MSRLCLVCVNRVLQKRHTHTHTHTHAKLTGLDEPLSREDVQLLSILSQHSSVHWETERDTISVKFDLFWLLLSETELQYHLQHSFGGAGRGMFYLWGVGQGVFGVGRGMG